MTWFEKLEIHLRHLYLNNLSYAVDAFKPAFRTFFGEEHQTFRLKMFHNLDQLRIQFERENLHEVNAKTCLEVLRTQFKEFFASKRRDLLRNLDILERLIDKTINKRVIDKTVLKYGKINLAQAVDSNLVVTESSRIESENNSPENALIKSVNETEMQMQEGKVDMGKVLDAGLGVTESNEIESERHVSSSRSRNDTHAEDVDIKPVNDKEPMAEVQLTAQHNVLANEQQHSMQSEPIYDTHLLEKINKEIEVLETINIELEQSVAKLLAENEKLRKENEHLKQTYKYLYDSIKKTLVQIKDHNDSLIAQINSKTVKIADLKAQIQEKVFANVALKNELRKLKGKSVDTKFAKPSILGKPVLQPPRNQSVVRQPNAFKSERPNFSKPRFASQVNVNNVLSKPVTPHYLPKFRESVFVKPNHVIASGSSRNSSKELYGSNDMAHNYYLEEAKKKTQDKNMNLKPSGFQLERHSPLAQQRLTVNLQMVQMMISLTYMNAIKLLMSVQTTLQAPLLKEKKSVRFSALYLQKKRNLLIVTTSRYVVPTGRVKVPAGRYVVPTGKDNVIVSAGRSKVIPAGRTILVLLAIHSRVVSPLATRKVHVHG
ncbi:reverse transcriptase domain-containing protein [Tanacetum coccineum]